MNEKVTNFSIFDKEFFMSIFGGKVFPDGSLVIDYMDEIMDYQKAFMEVCSRIRSNNMMTFPVLTISLLYRDGKFVDEDFAVWACRHNMKWCDSNFYVSGDVTSLSNCCFDGSQMTLTKSSNGVNFMTFKELAEASYKEHKRNFTIFHNGSWVDGKLVTLPSRNLYKVTTANKKEIIVTDNHINATLRGDVPTSDLTTDDYLLFNTSRLDSVNEADKHLTYNEGFLIGLYLGDGSMESESATRTTTINFSLNETKYKQSKQIIKDAFKDLGLSMELYLSRVYNNVYPAYVRSNEVAYFIREYVIGNYCYEKELNMDCLLQSYDFRKGILDGYYMSDGGNSNRIYTTSVKMVSCLEALITSLGLNSVIDVSDRTGVGEVVIRGESFNRNYPLYCVRWYDYHNRRSRKDVYLRKNNSAYYKITSIEPYESDDDCVYCFEMENKDEQYFTLPNGIITHNCRLLSNIKNMAYFNSIGGAALEVGSVKVNTINLARIAYENSIDDYFEVLKKKTILCLQCLDRVRHIIKRNEEKGLLPNYSYGLITLDKQYNTIGIIGGWEAADHYGLITRDEFGYAHYTEEGIEFEKKIFDVINSVKDEFPKDYLVNIEQIPGERAAQILMDKDKFFYPKEKYELPLYGNQWIPLGVKTSLQEKIKVSAILDKACSGGSIAHINIDKPFENFDTAWKMLNYVAKEGVNYFAFNTRISACEHNHGFYGEICPICGGRKVTTYQRIVGFLTPERTYSESRKKEFKMRDWFKLNMMSEI